MTVLAVSLAAKDVIIKKKNDLSAGVKSSAAAMGKQGQSVLQCLGRCQALTGSVFASLSDVPVLLVSQLECRP